MSIREVAREAHEAKRNEGGPRQFKRNGEATQVVLVPLSAHPDNGPISCGFLRSKICVQESSKVVGALLERDWRSQLYLVQSNTPLSFASGPLMEATEKLQEALYFLEKIKKLEDKAKVRASEDSFKERRVSLRANLSAFILAWQSVPEILLYDFAEGLSLGISRDEKTARDYFMHLSKGLASRNASFSEAVQLYEWLDQQQRRLFETHELLAEWRHVVAHRGIVAVVRREHGKTTLQEQVVEVDMPINTTGSFGVSGSFGPSGWVPSPVEAAGARAIIEAKSRSYELGVARPLILRGEEMKKESYSYLRNDSERRPIVERCQNAYNDMRKLVEDARKRIKS